MDAFTDRVLWRESPCPSSLPSRYPRVLGPVTGRSGNARSSQRWLGKSRVSRTDAHGGPDDEPQTARVRRRVFRRDGDGRRDHLRSLFRHGTDHHHRRQRKRVSHSRDGDQYSNADDFRIEFIRYDQSGRNDRFTPPRKRRDRPWRNRATPFHGRPDSDGETVSNRNADGVDFSGTLDFETILHALRDGNTDVDDHVDTDGHSSADRDGDTIAHADAGTVPDSDVDRDAHHAAVDTDGRGNATGDRDGDGGIVTTTRAVGRRFARIVPGMYPAAPKRNVVVASLYCYAAGVAVAAITLAA